MWIKIAQSREVATVLATIGRNELTPHFHFIASSSVIVSVNENGEIRATHNCCGHQCAKFGCASGCISIYPHHGWQLDLSRVVCTSPTIRQVGPELTIEWISVGR